MNKIIIEKKYNKQLNIFLSIYITLCLIFALLFNGFFVKPKAYTENTSFTCYIVSDKNYAGTTSNYSKNYKFNVHSDTVFYYMPSITTVNNDSNNYTRYLNCFLGVGRNNSSSNTISISSSHISGDNYGDNIRDYNQTPIYQAYNNLTSSLGNSNYIKSMGFFLGLDAKSDGVVDSIISTLGNSENIQYIDNIKDLQKWLNGNDDVVKIGDPQHPPLPEDNSLPVPQSLTCDLKNNDEGAPRFMAGTWKNPSNLLASYDANDIYIEIQYKPKLQFYKKLFDLKLGVGTSSSWLSVTKKKISEIDNWVSYMNLSDNNPSSTGKSFHKNGKEDIENIASLNDLSNISSHVELLNGSSWRCRYVINGKTSLWVVYGVDSINQFGRPSNSGDNITFENASGEPISSNDVEYDNSNMTDKNYDNLSFIGKIRYDLDNLFSSLKSFFTPLDNNNGFYAFFGRVFEEFPIFWTLFILGLVVAILLRIFGR